MSFNVSLDKAPKLHRPILFFINALVYLVGFIIIGLKYEFLISDRFSPYFLITLHFFTIGFLINFIWGALVQLLPVLFGIESFKKNHYWFLWIISLIAPLFFILLFSDTASSFSLIFIIIIIGIYLFSIVTILLEIYNLYKLGHQDTIHYGLFFSIMSFLIGMTYGLAIAFHYYGFLQTDFRLNLTNQHVFLMSFGFLFTLIMTVASKIVPMFYVTDPVSKKQFKIFLLINFLGIILFLFGPDQAIALMISLFSQAFLGAIFLYIIIRRRRKRINPFILSWNIIFGVLVLFSLSLPFFHWTFESLIYGIIVWLLLLVLTMFKKIYSFLFWLHLNNLQMKSLNFNVSIPNINDFYVEYWHYFTVILLTMMLFVKNYLFWIFLSLILIELIWQFISGLMKVRSFRNQLSLNEQN